MTGMPLIIESPQLQSVPRRTFYGLLTLSMWVLWIWLWLPLVTLLAWLVGLRLFAEEVLRPENFTYAQQLLSYGQAALVILAVVLAWSYYNARRFRGHERRHRQAPLTPAEEAAFYGLDEDMITQLRNGRRSVVYCNDDSGIVQVATEQLAEQDRTITPQ